jgi:uncharacterized protein YjbI with pentapeptide repeats
MREEIDRILRMVEDGKLDREQAAAMIAAVSGGARSESDQHDPRRRARGERQRHRGRHSNHRHRHHNRRRSNGDDLDTVLEGLGEDLQRAVETGSKTLRKALQFSRSLGLESWVNDSNSVLLSKTELPAGSDFRCENNAITVSQLRGLVLEGAEFCDNEFNAAQISGIEIREGSFNGQQWQGASIRDVLIEDSHFTNNQSNGASLSGVTLARSRVSDCAINGAQIKELGLSASSMENTKINGAKLKALILNTDTHVRGLNVNGVMGRNLLFEGAVLDQVTFSALKIDGLLLKNSGLEQCAFEYRDWAERLERQDLGRMRDVEFEQTLLSNCHFRECRFEGTRFRGFKANGLDFQGVDFSGLTIDSLDAFKALAEDARVA